MIPFCPSKTVLGGLVLFLLANLVMPVQAASQNWLRDALKQSGTKAPLDAKTAADGLRQALDQGAQQAVRLLGRPDGYFGDLRTRIPMPDRLARIEKSLRKVGKGAVVDEFILTMNRAAEQAVPEASAIFLQVIRQMSVDDAIGLVRGADDSATQYFRRHAEQVLRERFRPLVASATDRVGVTHRYKKLVKDAGPVALLLDSRSLDLDAYITGKALDGLFLMMADEERRIRHDPAARATEILRKVFGR